MKKATFFLSLLTIIVMAVSFFSVNFSMAGDGTDTGDVVKLTNPLDGKENSTMKPADLIGKVINGVLGIVGSLALLMFIYGGFTWMTAAGASDKVQHGKDVLVWATIGLVVIFSSYAMVRFVFRDILGGA